MTTRTRYLITYRYPGSFFPEEATEEVVGPEPSWEDLVMAAPVADNKSGWCSRDGWYAASVKRIEEELFIGSESGAQRWIQTDFTIVTRYVVGTEVHMDEIPEDTDEGPGRNRVLKANIRDNDPQAIGVITRCGNWQLRCDYDVVVAPKDALRGQA